MLNKEQDLQVPIAIGSDAADDDGSNAAPLTIKPAMVNDIDPKLNLSLTTR